MVLGDSLKNSFAGRIGNAHVLFGLGLLSGIAATIAVGTLRPMLTAMWRQPLPTNVSTTGGVTADESQTIARATTTDAPVDLAIYFTDVEAVRLTRKRLEMEAIADANLKRSKELAVQAIDVRDAGREDDEETLSELQHQEFLWTAALQQLAQIPEDSMLAEAAAEKREGYSAILGPVQADIDQLKSAFLADIAEATGRPRAIRITICHHSGRCLDYRGDQPPATPSNPIKLPVAVVLIKKSTEESLAIGADMYLHSPN